MNARYSALLTGLRLMRKALQLDHLGRLLIGHHRTLSRADPVVPLLDAPGVVLGQVGLQDLIDLVVAAFTLCAAGGDHRQKALVDQGMPLCQVPDQPAVVQQGM